MAKRRRRSAEPQRGDEPHKRCRTEAHQPRQLEKASHHVLSAYFSTLLTLRQYFIARLSSLKRSQTQDRGLVELQSDRIQGSHPLCSLLDTTLVGLDREVLIGNQITQDIVEATASSPSWSVGEGPPQSEIVQVAIRILFSRRTSFFPANILTGGYKLKNGDIVCSIPNAHVQTLKSPLWQQLLKLVREAVMLDLLLTTSVFIYTKNDCFYQLIGNPISEGIPTQPTVLTGGQGLNRDAGQARVKRPTSDVSRRAAKRPKLSDSTTLCLSRINFGRSKMFSSRPTVNSRGDVTFGFRHSYVLNRYSNSGSKEETIHVLRYIFPKQCGLSNLFTSTLSDYTQLEEEINHLETKNDGKLPLVPRRLNGTVISLIAKLQKLQSQCPYNSLLRYYCPVFECDKGVQDKRFMLPKVPKHIAQAQEMEHAKDVTVPRMKVSFTDHASSVGEISAFVHAVVGRVIPKQFFGGAKNQKAIMRHVDRYIRLRRFEALSLHDVIQGLKIKEFAWLVPHGMNTKLNISQSDKNKRLEILAEFLYWFFDGFISPLISAHFYVTESSISNSQKIFYFRHDIWRKLSEPALQNLKLVMFEDYHVRYSQQPRRLGYCGVRLLPKETGFRPIMNLGKKPKINSALQFPKTEQQKSINAMLQPVFSVLKYEKNRDPECVGSTMFNAREVYPRLKAFKNLIQQNGWQNRKLYFVKLDIQACFDSIPQRKLIQIVENLLVEDEYRLEFHAEVRPADYYGRGGLLGSNTKVFRKFQNQARGENEFEKFEDFASRESEGKRHVVFVDKGYKRYHTRRELMDLLKEHVLRNMVKVGNKIYRQKKGIPQGSVLSTILSGILYGTLEQEKLPFCKDPDGLLVRLVDDFLFITLNRNNATKFLTIMYNGVPEYGAKIGIEKCLVNFETSVNGNKINRLVDTLEFPYCGNTIHTKTLDFKKDMDRRMESNLQNSLTTVISKNAGRALHQKTVKSFKMNADTMFLDVQHNSTRTVLTNIYRNFAETAMKCYRYSKSLPRWKRPNEPFMIKIVSDILDFAFTMLKSRQKIAGNIYTSISESQVKWLGAFAFFTVFERKQSSHKGFLRWLAGVIAKHPANTMCTRVAAVENSIMASRTY